MISLWLFALLVLFSGVAAGLIYIGLRRQGARLAALKELAQTNGWGFAHDPGTLGRAPQTVFSDADWTLTVSTAAGPKNTAIPHAIWQTTAHGLDSGAAILGLPPVQPQAPKLQKQIKTLAFQYVEDMSEIAKDIKMISASDQQPGGTLFATPGQEHALDAIRANPLLQKQDISPLVIRDTTGLQLRVRDTLSPEQLGALAALGASLRDDLSGETAAG